MMNSAHFAARLAARRQEIEHRLQTIEADLDSPRSPDDDDRAIESDDDEVLERLGVQGETELAAIDAALDRIRAGTFGICSRCGAAISVPRLESVPHTVLCEACMTET